MCEPVHKVLLATDMSKCHDQMTRWPCSPWQAVSGMVHLFGSVPQRTYLPDGDIDLTVITNQHVDDVAKHLHAVLEQEQQNTAAQFKVKEVQYIHAEVQLIKCLVESIVVDISFNQYGGLCTHKFLDLIDHIIGYESRFKHSLVLIKAWCYYESHVLGSHHGLFSTYALEIMVMYIFQFFGASLRGPLEVMYKFLDYFSKFNWDKYSVSLNGPFCLSSLPEIVVEKAEIAGGCALLSEEHLRHYVETVKIGTMMPETSSRPFTQKHLNIMDPLKENNNLGRSVSRASFYRIRSAFSYGANNLGEILLLPERNIPERLVSFFKNTLNKNENGQRTDVQCLGFDDYAPATALPLSFPSDAIESGYLAQGFAFYPPTIRDVTESGFYHWRHVSYPSMMLCADDTRILPPGHGLYPSGKPGETEDRSSPQENASSSSPLPEPISDQTPMPKPQGVGTFFLDMKGEFRGGRRVHWRGNKKPVSYNQLRKPAGHNQLQKSATRKDEAMLSCAISSPKASEENTSQEYVSMPPAGKQKTKSNSPVNLEGNEHMT